MIVPGNGYNLIKDVVTRRGADVWKEVFKDDGYSKANFIWKPTNFNPILYLKIDN